MFKEMRRSDRAISREDVEGLLASAEYGILSTTGENGYPYGVPVNFVYIGGRVYFHCAAGTGAKIENIRRDDKVCFTVVGGTEVLAAEFSTRFESAVAFGRAREVEGERKQKALEGLIAKYSPQFAESGAQYIEQFYGQTGVVEIEIDHVTGKARR